MTPSLRTARASCESAAGQSSALSAWSLGVESRLGVPAGAAGSQLQAVWAMARLPSVSPSSLGRRWWNLVEGASPWDVGPPPHCPGPTAAESMPSRPLLRWMWWPGTCLWALWDVGSR